MELAELIDLDAVETDRHNTSHGNYFVINGSRFFAGMEHKWRAVLEEYIATGRSKSSLGVSKDTVLKLVHAVGLRARPRGPQHPNEGFTRSKRKTEVSCTVNERDFPIGCGVRYQGERYITESLPFRSRFGILIALHGIRDFVPIRKVKRVGV